MLTLSPHLTRVVVSAVMLRASLLLGSLLVKIKSNSSRSPEWRGRGWNGNGNGRHLDPMRA